MNRNVIFFLLRPFQLCVARSPLSAINGISLREVGISLAGNGAIVFYVCTYQNIAERAVNS